MKKALLIVMSCLIVLVFFLDIVAMFLPKKDGEFHVREFGRLPVVMNGRVQPFDSVGRNTLLQIRSTGDVPLEEVPSWKFWHHAQKLRSSEWLLEVLFKPELADTRPIFLIHHPELLSELNLQDTGVERSGLRYYTFNQLTPVLGEIQQQASKAPQDEKQRTPLQKQVMKLYNALYLYQTMKAAAHPPTWQDPEKDFAEFEKTIDPGMEAMRARDAGQEHDKKVLAAFFQPVTELFNLSRDGLAGQRYPLIIPPYQSEQKHDDWTSMAQALLEGVRSREFPAPVKTFLAMGSAYAHGDAKAFNAAVDQHKSWLTPNFAKELKKGRHEFFFNDAKPFLHSLIIYVSAFVIAAFALLLMPFVPNFSEALRQTAFWLIVLTGVVHTFGLVFRMYLEGRPPVTNLYSSAIFIGWGAMVLGIILEKFYRLGLGNIVASLAGWVTLLIAQNLAIGGDTMEMMRAVLDTNFWLATHVVTVTLGYASTFVAGLLGILFIVLGVVTPVSRLLLNHFKPASRPKFDLSMADTGKALAKMAYAIICFATLFSFIGTVLGGIWADQSWGRFWGWDPKENGALIIVLWNAVILHARWGGLVRERGLMNMAVFGNIVTAWSWFGVNMLGVGLHSYGFMDSGAIWLYYIFVPSQLAIIIIGLILSLMNSLRKRANTRRPLANIGDAATA